MVFTFKSSKKGSWNFKIKYPELTEDEVEEIRQYVVVDSVVKSGEIKEVGDQRFIRLADKFINIDELSKIDREKIKTALVPMKELEELIKDKFQLTQFS